MGKHILRWHYKNTRHMLCDRNEPCNKNLSLGFQKISYICIQANHRKRLQVLNSGLKKKMDYTISAVT